MSDNMQSQLDFIDVSEYNFLVEPRYYFYGWSDSPVIKARANALFSLVEARKILLSTSRFSNFKIWDCQRTFETQSKMVESFRKRLKLKHPDISVDELENLVFKFSGGTPVNVEKLGTHRNGGSFDLTMVDSYGNEAFMGTDHDDLTNMAATNFFKTKSVLGVTDYVAKDNREVLCRVMTEAGFRNYDAEWWHWSWDK